ncbi:bifunctional protein-serine/threonine kinase/phosphatase [Deinococcus radiopugnans]|uniref:bifunctional protein-serine/threonine kinase/phosphatase n=1 Tax=Deinococcus radiopugnans TaxID=57497 RepID=UPI003606FFC3
MQSGGPAQAVSGVYLLGAVLYCWLSGQPLPPEGASALTLSGLRAPGLPQLLHRALAPAAERLTPTALMDALRQLGRTPAASYRVAAATTVGLNVDRPLNEDAFGHHLRQIDAEGAQVTCLRACVADGMGGMAAGEVASRAAVEGFLASTAPDMVGWVWEANAALLQALNGQDGGCAFSGVQIEGQSLQLGHVGDTRAYHASDGEVRQLTQDHSYVAAMVANGMMTPEDAASSPERNKVLRSLGSVRQPQEYYVQTLDAPLALVPGARVLLVSDGVWGGAGAGPARPAADRARHPAGGRCPDRPGAGCGRARQRDGPPDRAGALSLWKRHHELSGLRQRHAARRSGLPHLRQSAGQPDAVTRHGAAGQIPPGRGAGAGGFGITYAAVQQQLGVRVAIKELFPAGTLRQGMTVRPPVTLNLAGWAQAKRDFTEEGRVLARFGHPDIVRVMDLFEEAGTAYLVMEFLEGQTLGGRIERGGALPAGEVEAVSRRVLGALGLVHGAGLLHRDLKPDNILLEQGGRVVLIDFGSARGYAQGQTVNHTRLVTPGYAPLEQYGSAARFGPYTDIYALGATLYHALTGQAPPAVTDRMLGTPLPPLPPGTPPGLRRAIERSLEIKVTDRPQTTDEVLALLAAPPAPEPVPRSPAPPALSRPPRPRRLPLRPAAARRPGPGCSRLCSPAAATRCSAAGWSALPERARRPSRLLEQRPTPQPRHRSTQRRR